MNHAPNDTLPCSVTQCRAVAIAALARRRLRGEAVVAEIAAGMPAHLREQRGLLLIWKYGGRVSDYPCPACEGQPIVGHQQVDYENEPTSPCGLRRPTDESENRGMRDGIVPVLCVLCHGFGSVTPAIDQWFRDQLAGVGGEKPRYQWRPGAREEQRNWGRMAEGGGARAVTVPQAPDF